MHHGRSPEEVSLAGEEMGITDRGALIAAGAGAGLGLLGSMSYLKTVEKKAFDRGFLDAQEGKTFSPSMEGDNTTFIAGPLPNWLTYLGIGLGTSAITGFVAEIAQSPWAATRVKSAYAQGFEQGS